MRGPRWDERDPSLNLPSGSALAASWDADLAYRKRTQPLQQPNFGSVFTNPPGDHAAEFSEWAWKSMDEVLDLVVPFKREVYDAVIAEFRHLETA